MANKYINKVIVGKETKLDLTADTVTPNTLAEGITAHDKSGAPIVGTSTKDVDSSDATAAVAEVLKGKLSMHGARSLRVRCPITERYPGKSLLWTANIRFLWVFTMVVVQLKLIPSNRQNS